MYTRIKKFTDDIAGNMTAMFAGAAFLCLTGVAVAVDTTGMMSQKSRLQSYADLAVLAAASSNATEKEELEKVASTAVNANQRNGEGFNTELHILKDNTIRVTVSQNYPMSLMGIFGVNAKPINVVAEAPPKGSANNINLALVLDVTESMTGAKLVALKSAATDLVTDLDEMSKNTTQFSVVPFARYVKLPTSYSSASWVNIAPSGEECWNTLDKDASTNCTHHGSGESAYTTCENEVYTETCVWKDWDGCMGSRDFPWYERDYVGPKKLQGFTVGDWCGGGGSQLLPLTGSVSAVTSKIDGLWTHQDTYIPAGLMWGWRTLTPEAPLTEADTTDYDTRSSALILMTDGENSQSFGGKFGDYDGNYHWEGNASAANTVTKKLCENIKADGITIYTIAFSVSDSTTQTLLAGCASDTKKFFDVDTAAELKEAFSGIGKDLSLVRLSK